MSRLTENDKHFGPFTYGKTDWKAIRLVYSSEGSEYDDPPCERNSLTAYFRGNIVRVYLPRILKPVAIDSRGYRENFAREYGFSFSDDFFQLYLGASTHDSDTNQSWGCFLPWKSWKHVRHSLYDIQGNLFYQYLEGCGKTAIESIHSMYDKQNECPSVKFEFDDYDGKRIVVTTRIEEREWLLGTGSFKWLRYFSKPRIVRSLNLHFSEEVGPEKGSYKGGTIGHSIEMLPGEMHQQAFERYCQLEHSSRHQPFHIKYVGVVQ